ncbi:MAG: helix-turn-helix domain-containing protein, partial [Phycisphaeraceae bacterium]|nr:helix-turn-helix domain-containing protein [Phycisphaeraceae bacterium]
HLQVKTNICSWQHQLTASDDYHLQMRTVADYNLIYAMQGEFVWEIDGIGHPMSRGTLVLVPPGVPHRAWSTSSPWELGSIHVEVSLSGGQDVFDLVSPPRCQEVEQGSPLDQHFRGAIQEFQRSDPVVRQQLLRGWSRLVVVELLLYDAAKERLTPRPMDPVVGEVLHELHRRVGVPVDHAELAAWAGYSPQHLNRVFRKELGVTPLQYLARLRMEHAASLVLDGRLTLKAVAQRVGISDPYYFSRLFHQHFGMSAKAYRAAAEHTAHS